MVWVGGLGQYRVWGGVMGGCAYMYAALHTHTQHWTRRRYRVVYSITPLDSHRESLSLNPELGSHRALVILLPPFPMEMELQRCTWPHLAFYVGAGELNSGPHACQQVLLAPNHLPSHCIEDFFLSGRVGQSCYMHGLCW